MKKLAVMALTGILAVGSLATVYAATGYQTAVLQDTKIRFNGGGIQNIQCYNIEGYNFIRARDITNHLDMTVTAIQNGNKGVMVDPYSVPASKGVSEKLTQQSARVKVETGQLIYDGIVSETECFLLNGRYYFKLADFAAASGSSLNASLELTEIQAKGGIAAEPFADVFPSITVEWNKDAKIIEVNRAETDLQKIFDDIRGGKATNEKQENETGTERRRSNGVMADFADFQLSSPLTSAPKAGEVPAHILIDESESAYTDHRMAVPNTDNYTLPYVYAGSLGQCTWYAKGRFIELYGTMVFENKFYGGGVNTWVEKAQSSECPDVDGVTDPEKITAGSIAVFEGHALFVEWVEYDASGNPTKVYFTEANTQRDGKYYPDQDAKVQVMDFDKFIVRQPFIGYVKVK